MSKQLQSAIQSGSDQLSLSRRLSRRMSMWSLSMWSTTLPCTTRLNTNSSQTLDLSKFISKGLKCSKLELKFIFIDSYVTGVLGKPGRWKSPKNRPDYPDSSGLPRLSGLPHSYIKPIFLTEIPNYSFTKDLAPFPRLHLYVFCTSKHDLGGFEVKKYKNKMRKKIKLFPKKSFGLLQSSGFEPSGFAQHPCKLI